MDLATNNAEVTEWWEPRMVQERAKVNAAAMLVEHLGHNGGRVAPTVSGARWFAYCSCGFVTSTRPTEKDALGALVHHLKLAVRKWRLSGVPITAYPPAPAPDWAKILPSYPHLGAYLEKSGVSLLEKPEKAVLTS